MQGHGTRPYVIPRSLSATVYPLTPIPSSPDDPGGDNSQEMSRLRHDRSSGSTSAHSPAKRGRSHTHQAPCLPLPSDVPADPDSPVSEQAAELIHEFVHPHSHHRSRENLFGAEEPDEAGGNEPVIAKELEEMRSRVWWRRPSALWCAPQPCSPFKSALSRYNWNIQL